MIKNWAKLLQPTLLGVLLMFIVYVLAMTNVYQVNEQGKVATLDWLTQITPFEAQYPGSSDLFTFVDIDDVSLGEYGQWPWPRKLTAQLINSTITSGAVAVGVDILFSEEDRLSVGSLSKHYHIPAKRLTQLGITDGDDALGRLVEKNPVVLSYALSNDRAIKPGVVMPNRFIRVGKVTDFVANATAAITPIQALAKAQGFGFVNTYKDRGIIRDTPLILKLNNEFVPSLGLELLRVAQQAPSFVIKQSDLGSGLLIKSGELISESDLLGKFLFHYGHMDRFQTVSASKVLSGQARLENKIVVIGSSAKGLGDFHATNLEDMVAGPLIHLQLMDQIVNERFFVDHPLFNQLALWLALIFGALMCYLIEKKSMGLSLVLLMVISIVVLYLTYWNFINSHFILNAPIIMTIMLAGFLTTYFTNSLAEAIIKKDIVNKLESNQLLTEVMQSYSDSGDIYHALEALTPQIMTIIHADAIMFYEYDANDFFRCQFAKGMQGQEPKLLHNEIPLVHDIYRGRHENWPGITHEKLVIEAFTKKFSMSIHSLILLPVAFGSDSFGVLVALQEPSKKNKAPFGADGLKLCQSLADNLGIAIKNVQLGNKVVLDKLLEKDLKDAESAQSMMYPDAKTYPTISGGVLPYRMLAGDFIDYFLVGERIAFIQGDVSGKGVPAAIIMSRCAALFKVIAKLELEPHEIAVRMNHELCELNNDGRFVSLVLGWFDSNTGAVKFTNCGHNPVLFIQGDRLQAFGISAPPVGVISGDEFNPTSQSLSLTAGDAIYITTDGITESKYKDQELGIKGFAKIVLAHQEKNAIARFELFHRILTSGHLTLHDDATILVITK
tara:strand:- start:781 stop:3297 length:2517 start_codon:yes stop_codon:yes gene_type:complete